MNKPSLQVITLGCSKNKVDTEHLLAQVQGAFTVLPEDHEGRTDWLLLNTCGFIGDAKEESIQAGVAAGGREHRGLGGKILVFGGLSHRYVDALPGLIPEVDGWYGARDLAPVVKALGQPYHSGRRTSRYVTGRRGAYAFLKISEGCDRRCSYCAIPMIRGAHKSVPMEDLVDEAGRLAAEGVHELVLIAQDTTYYGLDLYGRRALAELLQRLSEVEGIEWIRIHYSYPAGFPEDVLDQMATNPKVCRYMDIPLQHVSDVVLDNMHRHVDGAWTRELIRKMRQKVPGIVLRTTLIVGHPGEGRKEFIELMDFVREARFERMGAFAYSEEEGTWGAMNLRDSVTKKTKQSRLSRLMELQRGISFAYNQSRIGSEVRVLVDDSSDGILVCRSEFESPEVDGEILVPCPQGRSPEEFVGRFMTVRIDGADDYDLTGVYLRD